MMKNKIFAGLLILFLLPLYVHAENTITRDPGEFNAVSVMGDVRVELYKAGKSSLEITYSGIAAEDILTENEEGILNIRMKTASNQGAYVTVKLYYTSLYSFEIQSNTLVTSPDVLHFSKMDFTAKSGAKFELKLDAGELNATVNQGAIMVFRGKVEKQNIRVSSGATYSAFELESEETRVKASTGGKAKIRVTEVLEGSANTKGYIGYKGNPGKIDISTSLGGELSDAGE